VSRELQATMTAILPENLEGLTIDSIVVGDSGFIVPWGMWVDTQRHCWLHPKYPIHTSACGTTRMRIELRQDGFHVWPPEDETWQPQAEPVYVSPLDNEYLSVAKLHLRAGETA